MAELKLGNKTIFSESGGTLTAHNLPKQMVINTFVIHNNTQATLSAANHGTTTVEGTYVKKLDDTHLYVNAVVWGHGWTSVGVGTCFFWYPGTDDYNTRSNQSSMFRDFGANLQHTGSWDQASVPIFGICKIKNLKAGNCRIGVGWQNKNRDTDYPFSRVNPNSSQDSRNQQEESQITIYEVVV